MTLQDKKFVSLSEYNIGLQTYQGNFVISLKYPDNWAVIEPTDKNIQFMRDEETAGVYYYVVSVDGGDEKLNGVFDAIDETIMYNMELQEKVELLNQKITELRDLFVEYPISKLRNLEFTFKRQKKKVAKKTQSEETKTDCEPSQEVNDTDRLIAESINRKKQMEDTSC
jgi:hypothetical protein